MSGYANLPASALIKQGTTIDEGDGKRRTKDEYRKMKDLEEQRKAGTAPAMVDVVTGADINPHIPEFIEKTPWYVPSAGPTLQHQRPHPERQKTTVSLDEWYPKGTTGRVAVKYRRGACENCGAMGHQKKDCFERPRPVGAKHTDEVIAADDFKAPTLGLTFDSKRDRWAGYDPSTYQHVQQEYEQMEETRKLIKAQQLKEGTLVEEGEAVAEATEAEAPPEELEQDEDMYADDAAPAQSVDMDSRTRITVRNLRIREDTAKYLYNLDPNGPHYDPKSRSMRENPFANMPDKEKEAAKFGGENFIRYTGEVAEANEAQVFAWTARCKGIDVHALAEPTKLEALRKEYKQASEHVKEDTKNQLLEKYGGGEHLKAPPKELLLAQTEAYVEYNRSGKVVKGHERPAMKSRYEEDVFPNNHTFIWGSYYKSGQWGYKCCHQFLKNTYCIGDRGFQLEDEMFAVAEAQRKTQAKTDDVAKDDEKVNTEESAALKEEESDSKERSKKPKERKKRDDDDDAGSGTASEADGSSGSSASEGEEESDPEAKERLEDEYRREAARKKKAEEKRQKRREKRKRQKDRKKNKAADEKHRRKKRKSSESSGSSSSSSSESDSDSDSSSESDPEFEKKKLPKDVREAMKRQRKEMHEGQQMNEMGDRKRKYHSNYEAKPQTEADIEAYNLTRIHASDPMAAYMSEKGEKKRRRNEKD